MKLFKTAIRKINFKTERDECKEQSKCKEPFLPAKQLSCALQGAQSKLWPRTRDANLSKRAFSPQFLQQFSKSRIFVDARFDES